MGPLVISTPGNGITECPIAGLLAREWLQAAAFFGHDNFAARGMLLQTGLAVSIDSLYFPHK